MPFTKTSTRRNASLGPLTVFREHSLHSKTGKPYVSGVGYSIKTTRFSSILYLVAGLIIVSAMGDSMADPVTWIKLLLWPLVLFMELLLWPLVLFVEFFVTIMATLMVYALAMFILVHVILMAEKCYRWLR